MRNDIPPEAAEDLDLCARTPGSSPEEKWFGWVECQKCGKVYEKKQLSRQIRHWLEHQYQGATK